MPRNRYETVSLEWRGPVEARALRLGGAWLCLETPAEILRSGRRVLSSTVAGRYTLRRVALPSRIQLWIGMATKTIDFAFFDAGGGHRSAATALQLACEMQQRPWKIRLMNLQEVLDSLDVFRKLSGIRLQDIYNRMLARGMTLGSAQLLPAMQSVLRLFHQPGVRLLANYWREAPPDMVVSLVPNLNRTMREALHRALPRAPYVTVLTDLADFGPHFWIEKQGQYFVCGTDRAVEQALALGHPAERVFRASGMILHPKYYEPWRGDRVAERQRLGLRAKLPTGLVLFGGHGSRVMYDIATRLDASGLQLQLILICGKNEELLNRLLARKWRMPILLQGFTTEVPYFMRLSDFLIGKPGPGSLSEALAMKLPVIVERNAWTLPQERFNTDWVRENHYGLVLRSFRRVDTAVAQLLEPEFYARCRARMAATENRAVFEIPQILERILAAHQ
ncbi:MAG: galactosyldiacylglycerol synthase [Acidobacteria bacterium]|nr:galactosyldiacylglycerol synthase [Acidobacteriota bacterium]